MVPSRRDEELILDVDEVPRVLDELDVSILHRVLSRCSVTPFGAASHQLS